MTDPAGALAFAVGALFPLLTIAAIVARFYHPRRRKP